MYIPTDMVTFKTVWCGGRGVGVSGVWETYGARRGVGVSDGSGVPPLPFLAKTSNPVGLRLSIPFQGGATPEHRGIPTRTSPG